MKENRKRLMEQEETTRKQGLEQVRDFHKGAEGVKENPTVQGKAPADPVESAFRDIKVAAQGRDRGKLPGGPGIEETDEEETGEEEEYEYEEEEEYTVTILEATLTAKDLSLIVAGRMDSEQKEIFSLYNETHGLAGQGREQEENKKNKQREM